MIHEVLLALLGHVGGLVHEGEDCFLVSAEADFLSDAEKELVRQVVQVGFYCKRIDSFVASVRRRHFSSGLGKPKGGVASVSLSGSEGHYTYGLVLCIEDILSAYRDRIVDLEAKVLGEPSLPLTYFATATDDDRRTLLVLHRLVKRVQKDELIGGPLLDLLWEAAACHMGSGSVYKSLWKIVSGTGQVLVNQLVGWLIYGRLVDPDGEFFIRRSRKQQADLANAALFGGPFDDLSSEIDAAAAQREWQGLFVLRVEAVPRAVLSIEAARKALFVGKAVRVLLRSGRWLQRVPGSIGSFDPVGLQDEVDSLRRCFDAKSPSYVIERGVEQIRISAASQLRQLVVEEADLVQHLNALKGFYLFGYGAFYQTFLESARASILQRPPTAHAEAELTQGPWALAMGEHEVGAELFGAASGGTASPVAQGARSTPANMVTTSSARSPTTSRAAIASRFAIRFVPRKFEFQSFTDASRQVKLVGMARLASGHAELGAGQVSASVAQSAMLWLAARHRVGRGFDQVFSFQVHAPPVASSQLGAQGALPEYGCRIALCFQNQWAPGALQAMHYGASMPARDPTSGREPSAQQPKALLWTGLGECLVLEMAYRVTPAQASGVPLAEVSLSFFACDSGLGDGSRLTASSIRSPLVEQLSAPAVLSVSAPRGMVHLVRVRYDAEKNELQAFFGADASAPACTASANLSSLLSLDLGCAYVGFCLVPLEHQHRLASSSASEGSPAPAAARYGSRDRPVSIASWRHRAHAVPQGAGATASSGSAGADEEEFTGPDAWLKSVELSYRVPWPLPLVITQRALEQYNRLFAVLMSVRQAHLELHRVDLARKDMLSWTFRAQLSYFVTQVQQYFQQDVIEVMHQRLLQLIEASRDFDEVVEAHEDFLATVTTNCFLRAPEVHAALAAALRIATQFCRLCAQASASTSGASAGGRPGNGEQARQSAAEVQRMQAEFIVAVRTVLRVMNSMSREGMHAHLEKLLLRLDYNGFFSRVTGEDGEAAPATVFLEARMPVVPVVRMVNRTA